MSLVNAERYTEVVFCWCCCRVAVFLSIEFRGSSGPWEGAFSD